MTDKKELADLTSEEKEISLAEINADLEKTAKSWGIDLSNVDLTKPIVNIENFNIVYALTHGSESPSSVEDFYERPFHERMSLFPKKDYY